MKCSPRVPWSVLAVAALAPLTWSCGEGGGGDITLPPDPAVRGQGDALVCINNPYNLPRPRDTDYVSVSGLIVTAVDTYDETNDGRSAREIYVQDMGGPVTHEDGSVFYAPPAAYGGITVYSPQYNPPSLKVKLGDVVDIRSLYQEFIGPSTYLFPKGEVLPQLASGTVWLRFESKGAEPRLIDPNELYGYENGRKWLGMLVEVRDIELADSLSNDGNGRWSAHISLGGGKDSGKLPAIANGLTELDETKLKVNTKLASVVGVVRYFQNFSIAPRSADDVKIQE